MHGAPDDDERTRAVAEEDMRRADAGEYVDVHAWTFSPESFRRLVLALNEKGWIALRPEIVHDTDFGELEFFAVLRKSEATLLGGPR